jgi:hypothetical protein
MDMLALKKRAETESSSHSILIYGDSGSGKTRMAATAALIPEINRIVWLDLENGKDTILHMGLPDEALKKIQLFQLLDTRKEPHVMNTMLKMFSSKADLNVCEEHGRVNCLECTQGKKSMQVFNITKMTHNDLLVIDSGSQLTDCGVNALLKGQPEDAILQIQEWGTVNNWLTAIMQVVQIGRYTNVVVLSHVFYDEEYSGTGPNKTLIRTRLFPMIGTSNYAKKVGKFFGTVVFLELKGSKHAGGSSTTYKVNCNTKSRLNVKVEESQALNMRDILVKGGIIRGKTEASSE